MPIDINLLRPEKGGNPELVRQSELKRCRDGSSIDKAILLDNKWRQSVFKLENLKHDLNKVQKEIGLLKKKDPKDSCAALVGEVATLKSKITAAEQIAVEDETNLKSIVHTIGNIVHSSVVKSSNEDENPVIDAWTNPITATLPSKILRHDEIMEKLDCYELHRGTEIAGHRGYYLKNELVLLNQALIMYGLYYLRKLQYNMIQPPYFVKKEIMQETAELADFEETLYCIPMKAEPKNDLYLIATSEQPIAAMHRRETLQPKQLPIKYAGISTCFRKEAGAHGKDMRGIFRTHQFEKIEQFVFCSPDDSEKMHKEMITVAKEFYQSIGLNYRVVSIVGGGLNNAASIKYDLEAWFPGYDAYRELVSCSNCTDYQARALQTRLGFPKGQDSEKIYVHMLNGTLCATERTMCCILENFQDSDGIHIPPVLQSYMGNIKFLPYKK